MTMGGTGRGDCLDGHWCENLAGKGGTVKTSVQTEDENRLNSASALFAVRIKRCADRDT